MGLMKTDDFEGKFDTSSIKFARNGLQSLELQVDSQPILYHPLKMKDTSSTDFFYNYLRNTNRFYNIFSNGSLTLDAFDHSNFMIYSNLKADGLEHGQLTLKLKFDSLLKHKLFCVFIPIYERKLTFDAYLNVQTHN